ncbi:hypothetical protein GCM10012284_12170 [Mangrovihabitans endophyticus]|uniref:Uncharacterized protein n=1 Tax=Mangrovihabitans endophyticus TaxID=1751298 RepID=A0A8J3BVA5_9ACTN|nr:hypothetical protein GCM10012284_12170 [Mangrovihabitans endophyticus]
MSSADAEWTQIGPDAPDVFKAFTSRASVPRFPPPMRDGQESGPDRVLFLVVDDDGVYGLVLDHGGVFLSVEGAISGRAQGKRFIRRPVPADRVEYVPGSRCRVESARDTVPQW